MEALSENFGLVLSGFGETLKLLVASGALALVVGTLVAVARVSPVPVLRGVGIGYVTIFRNTPLLVLILLTYYGLPEVGIDFGFFVMITLAMGLYTAAFVTEAIRSGINGIGLGQAEAARSIGMPFSLTMTQVVLPQAFRLTVPPLASVFIALTKNTSLAAVFGIAEATFRMKGLSNDYASERIVIFLGIALGYIVIVELISFGASRFEKAWRVA
ncbi:MULTISPECIES: amino acid ABC transporter permease [unclassified Aeromicrobium]|uniref:amino acid ABC transporter permease n=1 Tax=unclassified Aeromicrobium TaxID=2633570 RepID=UPI0007020F4C|nr:MULTISPECIES: amino acid ABC transporter permease [unclassified Aeromicrobium]KQO38865.1 amino acid ABC transporter permease [Aeromicrobium sp. Leaf245]KQP25628.1 amino acid ABC transporter permease [Aeromicrobium sp. Leaf272]KQP79799.1 amino acid ABC transporter permease [Aeromicrobium sp. Leaf289]KQP82117.1 amino acid ABC transporter permease [Aeromicrobium sp. Leaf291]